MNENEKWQIKDEELYDFMIEYDTHIPMPPVKEYKVRIRLVNYEYIYGSRTGSRKVSKTFRAGFDSPASCQKHK